MDILSHSEFLVQLADPDSEYRPIAFWFLNHWLEEGELVRQINEMAEKGMGGVMCHARDGLRSGYLDHEWEGHLRTIVDECKRLGLQVWLYDENHYPSGPAGEALQLTHPDRTMKSLAVIWEEIVEPGSRVCMDLSGRVPIDRMALAASLDSGRVVDLSPCLEDEKLIWTAPSDRGRMSVMVLGVVGWRPMADHHFPFYPDYLDTELMDEFVESTHRWYYERFGDDFGKTIRGIFTDNSCGNFGHIRRSLPWGKDLAERFRRETGEDIIEHLPRLFNRNVPGSERSRLIYWRFFGKTYMESFLGRIKKFCDGTGIFSTGHLCLEDGMGEHVRQIGDYFEVMRNFSLTAVDQLGPEEKGGDLRSSMGENLIACLKNTHSAALFSGSPRVMCESFGLASAPWKLDLGEMRRISGWMAALGVDLFVPHGLYYSIAGSRKWECTPDHLHNPLWDCYRGWTDWISRLSLAEAGGSTRAEVAVLYPINSLRTTLDLGDESGESDLGSEALRIQNTYFFALETLLKSHIDFQVIDEEVLCQGHIDSDQLEIPCPGREPAGLRVIVLPSATVIERRTLNVLESFMEAGGMVIALEDAPRLEIDGNALLPIGEWHPSGGVLELDSVAAGESFCSRVRRVVKPRILLNGQDDLVSRSWRNHGLTFYFIFNYSSTRIVETAVEIDDPEPLSRIDLETGEVETWNNREISLDPAEGLLLVSGLVSERSSIPLEKSDWSKITCNGQWRISTDRPNVLPLREWTVSALGSVQRCEFSFRSKIRTGQARLLIDLERSLAELHSGRYGKRFACRLNGKDIGPFVPGTYLDRNIYESPIEIAPGVNELELDMSACLVGWEYRLWPPMVVGDFGVDSALTLIEPGRAIETGDWSKHGFPFYAGKITYTKQLEIPRARSVFLSLGRVADACYLDVDGHRIGTLTGIPWRFDLSRFSGMSVEIAVTVINTANNLFCTDAAPAGLIGPICLEICG